MLDTRSTTSGSGSGRHGQQQDQRGKRGLQAIGQNESTFCPHKIDCVSLLDAILGFYAVSILGWKYVDAAVAFAAAGRQGAV